MDQQWTAYSEAPGATRQARYAPHNLASPTHAQRDAGAPPQVKQDPYASPTAPSRQTSLAIHSPGASSGRAPEYNDGDGDIAMEDADRYNPKFNNMARSSHSQRHSQQFIQQEESAAARRYSPMNLSPQAPYAGNAQQGGQNYTSFSPQHAQAQAQAQGNRQSPTRNNPYISSPTSYYSPPCMSTRSGQSWLAYFVLTSILQHPDRTRPNCRPSSQA